MGTSPSSLHQLLRESHTHDRIGFSLRDFTNLATQLEAEIQGKKLPAHCSSLPFTASSSSLMKRLEFTRFTSTDQLFSSVRTLARFSAGSSILFAHPHPDSPRRVRENSLNSHLNTGKAPGPAHLSLCLVRQPPKSDYLHGREQGAKISPKRTFGSFRFDKKVRLKFLIPNPST